MEIEHHDESTKSEAVQLHAKDDEVGDSKPQTPEAAREPPDGGYGWVVVLASCCNLVFLSSALMSFSVFLPEFMENLGMINKTSQVSVIGSIQTGFMFYFSILSGAMISRYGCRPVAMIGAALTGLGFIISSHAYIFNISHFRRYVVVCVCYGALSGIGISLGMTSTIVIVHQYFSKRRALASGLSLCGLSIGNLIVGPFLQFLIREYTLRGALLVQGGLILNGIPIGYLFRPWVPLQRPKPSPERTVSYASCDTPSRKIDLFFLRLEQVVPISLFKNVDFVLYCFGNFFLSFGSFSYLQHLINASLKIGVPIDKATLIFTILAAVSFFSRVFASLISDLKRVNRVLEFSLITVISGLAVALTPLAKNFTHMVVLAGIVVGWCMGASTTIQITILVDLVGTELLPRASGIFNVFIGTSVLLGVPLTGNMVDRNGDYRKAFALNGCLEMLGGLLILVIFIRGRLGYNQSMNCKEEAPCENRDSMMNGCVHSIHGNGSYDNSHLRTRNGHANYQIEEMAVGPV